MTLTQQLQTRRGDIGLTVYQDKETGQTLFSFNKYHEARLQKTSGLFTEKELAVFNDFIQDHFRGEYTIYAKKSPPKPNLDAQADYGAEIQDAIRSARENLQNVNAAPPATIPTYRQARPTTASVRITVLPTLPKYNYVYTCPKCTCHVASNLRVGPTSSLKLCSNCNHVLAATL